MEGGVKMLLERFWQFLYPKEVASFFNKSIA